MDILNHSPGVTINVFLVLLFILGTVTNTDSQTTSTDNSVATTDGNVITTLGNFTTTNGNASTTTGNVTTTVGQVTSTDGNVTTTNGHVTSTVGHFITTDRNVNTTDGNVTTTVGHFTTTDGNVTTTDGNVTTTVGHITTTDGNVITTDGNVTNTTLGHVTTTDGNVTTPNGYVTSTDGHHTTTFGQVTSTDGNVATTNGQVTAPAGYINTTEGNVTTTAGHVSTTDRTVTTDANVTSTDAMSETVTAGLTETFTEVATDTLTEILNTTSETLTMWFTEIATDLVTDIPNSTETFTDIVTETVTELESVTPVYEGTDVMTTVEAEPQMTTELVTTNLTMTSTTETPTTDLPSTELPSSEQPSTELPSTEPPSTEVFKTTSRPRTTRRLPSTTRRPTEPTITPRTPRATPSPTEEKLEDLMETPVTDENVETVSEELANLTSNTEELTSEGVEDTVDILQNITALNSSEPEVTTAVVETVNNLMEVSEDELEQAAEEGATNDAIQALESQLDYVNVSATNGTYTAVDTNIGVQVTEYPPEELAEGLTFSYATNDPNQELQDEELSVQTGEAFEPEKPVFASLSLPYVIADEIGDAGGDAGGDDARISFIIYRESTLFLSSWLIDFNKNKSFERRANTAVISASVDGLTITNLSEPVITKFRPFKKKGRKVREVVNPTCVFWDIEADDGRGNWSTKGCRLVDPDDVTNPVCECNHLTNFAILMDVYSGERLTERQDLVLEVLSYGFCSLSLACLFISLLTFFGARNLRRSQPFHILIALSACLSALYVMFIVLAVVPDYSAVTCGVVTGLLHFALLTSICWMAVESFNMYLMVIKVFNRGGIDKFMWKASAFTFGVPTVIVTVTAGIAQGDYMNYDQEERTCAFLSRWAMVGGVLVPIATVIIYNTIIFIMVMKRLSKTVIGKQVTQTVHQERLRRLQNAIALVVLMGLTWASGFLITIESTTFVFQVIFTILNALQGVFLFVFYCLRNATARALWRRTLCPCLPSSEEASKYTNSTSTSNSNSRSRSRSTDASGEHALKWYERILANRGFYDLNWRGGRKNTTLEMSTSCAYRDSQLYKSKTDYSDIGSSEFLPHGVTQDGGNIEGANDNPLGVEVEDVETSFGNLGPQDVVDGSTEGGDKGYETGTEEPKDSQETLM